MKKALLAASIALAVAACGPAINLSDRPLFKTGNNAVTFLVYDGFTGAQIQNAKIKLVVGSFSLDAVQTEGTNSYIINQAPNGNSLVQIDADGYVGFLGQPFLSCGSSNGDPTNQCTTLYTVGLFPATSVTQDLVVHAFDEKGNPVTTGNVVATMTTGSSVGVPLGANQLNGTFTVRPNTVTATLDSSGNATLPKDKLVLGATYSIDVYGTQANGVYLAPVENRTVVVGKDFNELSVAMAPATAYPVAASSNNDPMLGGLQLADVEVNFTFPVELCSPPGTTYGMSIFAADGNGDGVVATAATNPVTPTLSNNNTKLTITPNFAANTLQKGNPPTGDGNIEVVFDYGEIMVKLVGASDSSCTDVFDVRLRSNSGPTVPNWIYVSYVP